MDLKRYSKGIQHIGIPTKRMDETVEFYKSLGLEIVYNTIYSDKRVAFLKIGSLVLEIYEDEEVPGNIGAINHIAIDVYDIEETFSYIQKCNLNKNNDKIHFLPFWKNGIQYFTIVGPNEELIEFCQYM